MDEAAVPNSYEQGMRSARAAFQAGRIREGAHRYEVILQAAWAQGDRLRSVETLLEFGAQLALHGDPERGAMHLDEAEYVALESGIPTDQGNFAFARGEVLSAQGEHDRAREQYLQSANEFVAADLPLYFLGAVSRWALEHEFFDDAEQAAAAHQHAIDAVRLVIADPKVQDRALVGPAAEQLVAVHLGRLAEMQFRLGNPIAALAAEHGARDIWVQVGRVLEVARCDVHLGNFYVVLECPDAARGRWLQAREALVAEGQSAAAAEIDAVLAALDEPGLDAGPELA